MIPSARYPNSHQANAGVNGSNSFSQLSTYGAVKTGSTKTIVLCVAFTAIATALLTAAIVVPVTLAVTNQGPFSTSAANSTANRGTTVASTAVTTVATTTAGSFSECSSYTTITDATRLTTAGGGSTCDSSTFSSSATWVRFSGAGGTQLATTAPSSNQCDTQGTGWYSSSLPSSGTTVNGTVCYVWSSNNCNWSNDVRVTNCGSFYVFGLIAPPACNLRYCTA